MLRIGFSTKFFTLWNVETTTEFANVGGFNLPYQKTSFNYIQNLSTNEDEAIKKASLMGCEDLDVDVELYGRNSSFEKTREMFSRMPSDKSFFFEFGKLKDTKIQDCTDSNYLFWYFQETQNVHCSERLLNEFGFVEFEGQLIQREQLEKIIRRDAIIDKAIQDGKILGQMVGNLDSHGCGILEVEENVILHLKFNEFKVCEYNGRRYGLPVKNGKGKRVKGQILEVELGKHCGNGEFVVKSFEIIKSQIIY